MFKSVKLTPSQEANIAKVHSRCESTCTFLTPIDPDKIEEFAAKCSEKNRELYRMANASNYAVICSIAILALAILFAVTHKK
jgi:hypothetical protein